MHLFWVRVAGPPVTTVMTVRPSELMEQESMTIVCVSDGNPPSRLVLSRELDGKRSELASELGPDVSVTLQSASIGDSGLYVCEASNDFGSQRSSVQVHVQREFTFTHSVRVVNDSLRTAASLHWHCMYGPVTR